MAKSSTDFTSRDAVKDAKMYRRRAYAFDSATAILTVLLLLMELEDPRLFLLDLKAAFESEYERQMAVV